MFNPLKLSILSLTVWMTGFLLVDCFSQSALTDEEQDGGPPSQNRFNNTNNLSFNQANRFPINGNNNPLGLNRFQSSPFASPFQSNNNNGFSSFNTNNNPFQQQQANSFLMNGFPSSQNSGFATQQQQSGLFPQNGFQSLNPNFNRNGGILSGQGSQFNSVNLQNQLMPGSQQQQQQQQLGLGFNQNFVQNPFMMQNQLGLAQNNPLALSLLQQNQLAGLQNNPLIGFQQNPFFNFQNQFGQQQQQQQPNLPFALQQQLMQGSLGLQNNDLNGSQFGLSSNPQLGSSNFGFNQNGLGFGGNFQQSNGLSPFNANTGLGTGSSSSLGLGANQILLQGGQFQDPNRFPFGGSTSSINNNRLPTSNGGLFGSQLAGSQSNNRFANDPFLSQRQQLKNSRNGNDRALDFNNTNNDNDGFARQPAFNPFQTPLLMGPVNRPLFGNQFPSPLDQQRLQMNQLAQQQMEEAPLPSPFGRQPSFQQPDAPNGSFNDLPPLNDNPQQQQQQQQQWFPVPIPETGFSCDGRPPGYYADVKNGCQTFHICIDDGISSTAGLKRSFACPNGTLFDQTSTICQWKDGVDCSKSQMFYPRPPPAAAATPQSDTIQQPPSTTASPFNTQIPSPTDNRFQHNGATPTSSMHGLMFSNVGQPSPALGSLDAGRSMHGFSRSSDEQHPGVRPALFRPSEQLN